MIKLFLKRNWLYILLLFFIVLLNVAPRFEKNKEKIAKATTEEKLEKKEEETLFLEFEDAQKRSKEIENTLRKNPPQFLFYIFLNLSIVFLFFLGLIIDGFFLAKRFKNKPIFKKMPEEDAPLWRIGDVFRIAILALAFGYVFFIALGFFIGFFEALAKTKFTFYKSENFRMIFDTIVLDTVLLAVILVFLRSIYKKSLKSLGFEKRDAARNIFYGICGYVGVTPILIILGILIYILTNILKLKPPPQPIIGLFLAEENVGLIFVSSIIASMVGPFIEEIFFRGVMYNAVKKRLGIFWAIFITSVLFSFLHTHAMTYFIVGFIPITILGMVLAYLYEKTASLIPSITLHVLNNLGSVIMVFAFKYFKNLVG